MQLKFCFIIHVAMAAVPVRAKVAPARLAATVGRTRASRADAALGRLAAEHPEVEVATGSPADSGDSDEALDAMCKKRPNYYDERRSENIRIGRAVRLKFREKNLPTSCPVVSPDDVAVTYAERMNDHVVTVGEARAITFNRPLARSASAAAEMIKETYQRCAQVRTATLYRHSLHMKAAWENMLAANSRHASASMCIKWDETQQLVGIGSAALLPEGLVDTDWATAVLMNIITFGITMKHTALERPYRFYVPPMAMQRTTAECLWAAFCRACATGPWLRVSKTEFAFLMWYIFCADEACSNYRFYAACETRLESEGHGDYSLSVFLPCLLHILHRTLVPLLKHEDLLNQLFRAANVLRHSTYWVGLIQTICRKIGTDIVIVHEDNVDQARLTRIADTILRLTLCQGKALDDLPKPVQKLFHKILQHLRGDWTMKSLQYKCLLPRCTGGADCKQLAIQDTICMIAEAVFRRKVQIPAANKWFKCTPIIRLVLLGTSLHSIFGQIAPRDWRPPRGVNTEFANAAMGVGDAQDENWHAIFAWRVRKSFDFFSLPSTSSNLILLLRCIEFPQAVMRWLMLWESSTRRGLHLTQPLQPRTKSRLQVVLEFVELDSSPICIELARGWAALNDEAHWECYFAYTPLPRYEALREIWGEMLPTLARLHTRCFYYICSWPLRAVLFLSQKRDQREAAATAFSNLDECCTPRGIKALRKQVRDGVPADCFAPKVLKCMEEFAGSADLTNFDKEIDHAHIKELLKATKGRTPAFETTAEAYLGAAANYDHARMQPPQPRAARGRQRKTGKKRQRFCGWNAFVQANPPTCEKCHAAADIKSGNHLTGVSATWATMDDAARQPFETIAEAKKIETTYAEESITDDSVESGADIDFLGAGPDSDSMWGIGDRNGPLSSENMTRPLYTPQFHADVKKWRQELGAVVEHEPNALSSIRLTYDSPCEPTQCESTAEADTARTMRDRLMLAMPLQILDVFVVVAGVTTHAFMVAHRIGKPTKLSLLRLRRTNSTTDGHLIHGTNAPWHFEFRSREVAGHSCLDFDLDIVCLIAVAETCRQHAVDTVYARSISNVMPTSLATFTATHAGKLHVLTAPHLEDLRGLADDCPEKQLAHDLGLADLRELDDAPRAPDRRRRKPAAASTEEEADEGFLEYEEELRAEGLAELKLAELIKPPGASAQPGSAEDIALADADAELLPDPPAAYLKPLAVIDDAVYDGWLQTAGRYRYVVDPHPAALSHLPLGQFQTLLGQGYRAVMRCSLPGHEKCTRMRNWKMKHGELPSAVDRALVAWQLQGRTVKPIPGETLAQAHMKMPHY